MQKVFLIASILAVAVVSTACINNLAVQDLNNRAKVFAEQGDYVQAIERLKSSIDLDPSMPETHYNLAVAYTQTEEFDKAIGEFEKVIEIKPDMSVVYYSLATAQNNLAVSIENKQLRLNEDGSVYKPEELKDNDKLTNEEKNYIVELFNSAISNYQKYLELNPNTTDKQSVENQIKTISEHTVKE